MSERSYKIRYLPLFENDLSEIVDYLTYKLKNSRAAIDLIDEVEKSILDRFLNPESFTPYQSTKARKFQYYRIYVKNFDIFYVIIDNKDSDFKIMEIRRILYNKRDYRKLI